jgi:ketosteroid isomerase-like protein
MSGSEVLATVRKLFEAVAHRDAGAYFAAYHPDILISEAPSLPYGGDYRGLEGVLRHAERFRATWDRYQSEDRRELEPEFLAVGNRVIVLWRLRARAANGEGIDLPVVSTYRLQDGKIIESRMYHFDTVALVRFLGKAGTEPTDARQTSEIS